MSKRNEIVFLATPSRGPWHHDDYWLGCMDASRVFMDVRGGALQPRFQYGSSIQTNRDILTALFMSSGASHLLFVDSDIGWRSAHLEELLDARQDVISGTYYYKQDVPLLVGVPIGGTGETLQEMQTVGAGFLLISRAAIQRASATIAEQLYHVDGVGIVSALWQDELNWGPGAICYREDAAFSKRCTDAGLKLWLHTGVRVVHHGEKAFTGAPMCEHVKPAALPPDHATNPDYHGGMRSLAPQKST